MATKIISKLNVSLFKKEAMEYAVFQYETSYKPELCVDRFMEGVMYTIEKLKRANLGKELEE